MGRGEATVGDDRLESGWASLSITHSSETSTPRGIEIENIGAGQTVPCVLDRAHQFVNGVQFLTRHTLDHDTKYIFDQIQIR